MAALAQMATLSHIDIDLVCADIRFSTEARMSGKQGGPVPPQRVYLEGLDQDALVEQLAQEIVSLKYIGLRIAFGGRRDPRGTVWEIQNIDDERYMQPLSVEEGSRAMQWEWV